MKSTKTYREPAPPQAARKRLRTVLLIIAAAACLFLAVSLLRPHQTGTVVRVGRIGTYQAHSGMGRRRKGLTKYSADVRVRADDTSEIVLVHYRTADPSAIPADGDKVRFAYDGLVGYVPFPQMWAVWTEVFVLGLDLLILGGMRVSERRKRARGPGGT